MVLLQSLVCGGVAPERRHNLTIEDTACYWVKGPKKTTNSEAVRRTPERYNTSRYFSLA